MQHTCPQTGRAIRLSTLNVYFDGDFRCEIDAETAIDGLREGLYASVGSKRSVRALVLLKLPNDEFPGLVPKMKPTSYQERVGGEDSPIVAKVWQHGRNALQWHEV